MASPWLIVLIGVLGGAPSAGAQPALSAEAEAMGRAGGAFQDQIGAQWMNPALIAAPPRYSVEAFYQVAGTRPARTWAVAVVDSKTSAVAAAIGYAERNWGSRPPGTPTSSLDLDPRTCGPEGCSVRTDRSLQLTLAGGAPLSFGTTLRHEVLGSSTVWTGDVGLAWTTGSLLTVGLTGLDVLHSGTGEPERAAQGSILFDFYHSFRMTAQTVRSIEPLTGPPSGSYGGGAETILFDQLGLLGGYRALYPSRGSVWSAGVAWYGPRFSLVWTFEASNEHPADMANSFSFSLMPF